MERGFKTSARPVTGTMVRVRSESFADHYSQARLFYESITPQEQKHLANAFTFELSKVENEAIRLRMLGHLLLIDQSLADQVNGALGAEGKAEKITPAKTPVELEQSPALRLYGKYEPTLAGRKVGVLLGAGFNLGIKKELEAQIRNEGARAAIVTAKIQGELDSSGQLYPADMALRTSPSVLFDAVVILAGTEGDEKLAGDPNALAFLMDAKRHCKAVGFSGILLLLRKAGAEEKEPGVVEITGKAGVKAFIAAGRTGRFWARESE
jgi:catalase